MTPSKTIQPTFIIVYPEDSFQDHMAWFLHCVPNWLLSRPYDLILSFWNQFTPFKTIWPNLSLCMQMPPLKTIWPNLSLCTQLTPFKIIWPNFNFVYPIDSFQDHMMWF